MVTLFAIETGHPKITASRFIEASMAKAVVILLLTFGLYSVIINNN